MNPVTELTNDITQNIDVSSPQEIVKKLEECDNEIFNGWKSYPNIFHEKIVETITQLAEITVSILKNPSQNAVILSGCGTSGRLAFVLCRSFNKLLTNQGLPGCYEYIIAGRDKALLTSQEAPEDDPYSGIKALEEVSKGKSKVVFIGITCGLSAPFVAGQLEYCMDHPDKFVPVLLGFNPVDLARNLPIENWQKTFLQVAKKFEDFIKCNNGFILNPIVGPEAITGSSRMKGGSTTKILLEVILMLAHLIKDAEVEKPTSESVKILLSTYQAVYKSTYQYTNQMAELVQWAANSLNDNGHIYYIGVDSLGIMGIIDASECPPTYGASLEDIRGFVIGGFQVYGNREGSSLLAFGEPFNISAEHFEKDMIGKLGTNDTVLFLLKDNDLVNFKDEIMKISELVSKQTCQLGVILFKKSEDENQSLQSTAILSSFKTVFTVELPWQQIWETIGPVFKVQSDTKQTEDGKCKPFEIFLTEFSLKLILNAISTGSHILNGKVYKNLMIDVKVSNAKLYHRAIGIIQKCGGCTRENARLALLKSIYSTDVITSDQDNAAISEHIQKATVMNKVVPTALVCTLKTCSVSHARNLLEKVKLTSKALEITKLDG
ncbi:glucokinase regulatory protein-like [Ptychodera flava]|uniref:glucokinase regulatory protein-like n=1 Tax=Ptychodera flava TaxID=63121 RepID=UPI003969E9D3